MKNKVLHLSPHPDDELIGAPATLMALRDSGWEITNYAVSLGGEGQQDRRGAELKEACARAKFKLIVPDAPFHISSTDDLVLAEKELTLHLQELIGDYEIVVSPSPHDRHHGHEVVGRALKSAIENNSKKEPRKLPPRWLMWGLWADLRFPTILCEFDEDRLQEILHCLSAHAGELERNDYRHLVAGRAEANAVLGYERIFGFGSAGPKRDSDLEKNNLYAEVCCEAVRVKNNWLLGSPHILDTTNMLVAPTTTNLNSWLS